MLPSVPMLALVALLLTAAPDAGATTTPYLTRAVTPADLEGKTLLQLSLMRNMIFARAGQVFRKPWVREHFQKYDWYKPTGLDNKKLTKLDRANAAAIAKYEIAIPVAELQKRRLALETKLANATKRATDDIVEMMLLSEAMGVAPPSSLNASYVRDPLVRPEVLDELVNVNQLQDLSRRDLRILRNTVFARRGRPFKTETMSDYFAKKSWYRADAKYTDKRLTKIDQANIKLIQSVEESVGGPETEAEVQGENEPPDGYMMGA